MAEKAEEKVYVSPRVNIIERSEDVLIEAELPGVPKDGIELEIKNDELTLIGHRAQSNGARRAVFCERARADYRRVFALSKAIDANRVEAEINDGLLRVTLHKVEAVKPRKIDVR